MNYRIALAASAEKELNALPAKMVARIILRIEAFSYVAPASGLQKTQGRRK